MRDGRVKGGVVVSAASVVALALVLAGCTPTQNQATNSPEASPSTSPVGSPTPSTTPPIESPLPTTSPTPPASPSPAKLIVTTLPFHPGEVGVTYAPVALGASGGVPPYKWSISSGALPPGLALSTGGSATGKPTASGSFSFVVRVDDSAGGAAGVSRTVAVVSHLSATGLCVTRCAVEEGCVTVCGKFGTQAGGLAPFKYTVSTGARPTGTTLNGLTLAGAMPPPPTRICDCSDWLFSVTVTDALGVTATVDVDFNVFSHIGFSAQVGSCLQVYGCTVQMPYFMGTPGGTASVALANIVCADPPCNGQAPEPPKNNLPAAGFSYSIDTVKQVVTITLDTPPTTGDWIGSIDVVITDQSLCGPGSALCSATATLSVDTESQFG